MNGAQSLMFGVRIQCPQRAGGSFEPQIITITLGEARGTHHLVDWLYKGAGIAIFDVKAHYYERTLVSSETPGGDLTDGNVSFYQPRPQAWHYKKNHRCEQHVEEILIGLR